MQGEGQRLAELAGHHSGGSAALYGRSILLDASYEHTEGFGGGLRVAQRPHLHPGEPCLQHLGTSVHGGVEWTLTRLAQSLVCTPDAHQMLCSEAPRWRLTLVSVSRG